MTHYESLGATSPTLLGRLRLGNADPTAWPQFVDLYGRAILAVARRAHCPEADLDDILQEVLVKLYRALPTFRYDPRRKFRAWLATITRNAVIDWLRSPQRRDRAVGGDDEWRAIESLSDGEELADAIYAEFQRELFAQAMELVRQRVQPQTWNAFALTELEGLSPPEAAERLAMPIANLYMARSRMMSQLKTEVARLSREFEGEES